VPNSATLPWLYNPFLTGIKSVFARNHIEGYAAVERNTAEDADKAMVNFECFVPTDHNLLRELRH
jgi:hypothetical protein